MTKYEAIVIGVTKGRMQALTIVLVTLPADFSMSVINVYHRKR